MPTIVRSHCKINLGLYIGAPRPDGFHSLVTVYQTLELHDFVTVTAHQGKKTVIRLSSNDPRVPTDNRNTGWKMVELALMWFGLHAEIAIHIEKRLPVQGGLGAGSANAVAALTGLGEELGLGGCEDILRPPSEYAGDSADYVWPARRSAIAEEVGSDVPLFLIGGAALGIDRGQKVYPLADFEPVWCVLALPEIGVSTPEAFHHWDALCVAEGLTQDSSKDRLEKLSRAYVSAFAGVSPQGGPKAGSSGVLSSGEDLAGPQESALVRTGITSWIQNDFERVVFSQHPSLAEIKRLLAASGKPEAALYASLSGSGSALYGLYLTREAADSARSRLAEAGVRSELTRTLPRQKYWSEMLLPNGS